MRKTLILGCGQQKEVKIKARRASESQAPEDYDITTLDIDPKCKPDIVHDLEVYPWPFEDDSFDEIHAYEVFEHLGHQGDYKSFFQLFTELARITKNEGVLIFTCPKLDSIWLWGDPGHRRYIGPETITYLAQSAYVLQVGSTQMTDYRDIYKADWTLDGHDDHSINDSNIFLLVNHK